MGWESAKRNFKNERMWSWGTFLNQCDAELIYLWGRYCVRPLQLSHMLLWFQPPHINCDTLWGLHFSLIEFHMHYCSLLWNGNDTYTRTILVSNSLLTEILEVKFNPAEFSLCDWPCQTNNGKPVDSSVSLSPYPSVLPDDFAGDLFHFLQRVSGECLCAGCAALLRPAPAEDLPPGLLLCGHWNRHQPAWGHTGLAFSGNSPCDFLTESSDAALFVHMDLIVVVLSPDKNLQQDHASVHLQHVHGRVNCGSDLQPGCHRYQPAYVVLLPLSQLVGHAGTGKKQSVGSIM